jgi:predicted metal-dependent hydrolase
MTEFSPAWLQGIDEFNRHEYYACHDTLESLWMDSVEPDKKFYQGVLQIAVGCYHLYNHNWKGAVILLGEGIGRLPYYQPVYEGIDVSQLIQDSSNLLHALQSLAEPCPWHYETRIEPNEIIDFVAKLHEDRSPLPVVRWV